jgi:hypothetical protein
VYLFRTEQRGILGQAQAEDRNLPGVQRGKLVRFKARVQKEVEKNDTAIWIDTSGNESRRDARNGRGAEQNDSRHY